MASPRLSVHLMVRNGAAVVGRGIRSVCRELPADDVEICYVDTGSTDGTDEEISKVCHELGVKFTGTFVTPTSHPNLFFRDDLSAYGRGRYEVPECTGHQLLADWAEVRNHGLCLCRGKYILKLDADDELRCAGTLDRVLQMADERPYIAMLCSPYEVMETSEMAEYVTLQARIWRNFPVIRFREACHENVDWYRDHVHPNWAILAHGLEMRDWRDNLGEGVRVPHRNLKVLLRQYCWHIETSTVPSQHLLIYLADEAAAVLPELALKLTDQLSEVLRTDVDRGWCEMIRAASYMARGELCLARESWDRALRLGYSRAKILSCLAFPERFSRRYLLGLWSALDSFWSFRAGDSPFYPRAASQKEIRRAQEILGDFRPGGPPVRCRYEGCLGEARLDSIYCDHHFNGTST
jgi:glycosyltransferase involved in cell wall biosynthesis